MNEQDTNYKNINELFKLTWFGESLTLNSGSKLWKKNNSEVTLLGQQGYKLTTPINWLIDPYNHRSWRWMLNSFHWMDSLLSDFKLNGNESSIQLCTTYFLDWMDFYIVKEHKGEFLWKDDAVSFRTHRLLIISKYILESKLFSENEKSITKVVLDRHCKELLEPKNFKRNNHGIFQMRALMGFVAFYPELLDLESTKAYVIDRLNWLWHAQYGEQGIHLENSTGYHQYAIEEFQQILNSPEFSGIKFKFNNDKVDTARDNIKFLFHPNGTGTLFGDSNLANKQLNITVGDHLFNEAGYAILAGNEENKENSYLAIRTGFPSNIHRHSDDFSFEWSEKGQVILQDSGRYSYDYNDPYRIFVSSTKSHNTVTINDSNFPWWGDFSKKDFYTGAVTSYQGNSKNAKIQLEKNFTKLEVSFNRLLEIQRGKSLQIIDKLVSQNLNDYEQWFHLSEDFEYLGINDKNRLVFESSKLRIEVVTPENTETIVVKGQKDPYLQGWVSYSEKKIIPRWSFGFKVKAKSFRFNTKIILV